MNTVQFSNHTQYREGWQGMVMPGGHIRQLVNGLAEIGVLAECDAILSGYLGSAEQGRRSWRWWLGSRRSIRPPSTFVTP